jgi:Peptidase family M48
MRGRIGCALVALTFLVLPIAIHPQQQLSDKDRKRIAEIEQRPEVQKEIMDRWQALQRQDMDFAWHVNISSQVAQSSPATFAEYRSKYGELYENPAVAQYVNMIGQRLVPKNSNNLYSFRLLNDPLPRAEALSTGTVYVSTGLVALLDNEAQLSYILGHEIAHIEKQHQYNAIRNSVVEEKLGEEKEADATKKRAIFTAITTVASAGIGGALGGSQGALTGALIGAGGGLLASQFVIRNRFQPTDWSTVEEDDADATGLQYALDQNYDVREVPKLLARLDKLSAQDSRIGLGFLGDRKRVKERIANVDALLSGPMKAALEQKLKAGLQGSSPLFPVLMEGVKRDDGILALDYDLFAESRDNLMDAVALRSEDARAQGYLGKVLSLTAQTPADRREAASHFLLAIRYDGERGAYPDPHLDLAVLMMGDKDLGSDPDIQRQLKVYMALYQRDNGGAVPHDAAVVYDYLSQTGDSQWFAPPAASVTTRGVGAVDVVEGTITHPPTTTQLTDAVLNLNAPAAQPQVVPVATEPATKRPAAKRVQR